MTYERRHHPDRRKHPNGHSPLRNILAEGFGLGMAEFASGATSLGVIAMADQVAPDMVQKATKVVSKICVLPYLKHIEKGLTTVCKLDECKPDLTQPEEQRAEAWARALVLFSAAFVASMAVKIGVRTGTNNMLGLGKKVQKTGRFWDDYIKPLFPNKHDWEVIAWDEGFHLGSLFLVNTVMAKQSDEAIKALSGVLHKTTGMSEKKAHEVASMGVIWEVPNFMGWLAGVGKIAHDHLSGSTHLHHK